MHKVAWLLLPRACKPHSSQEPLGRGASPLCKDSLGSGGTEPQGAMSASLLAGARPPPWVQWNLESNSLCTRLSATVSELQGH